MCGSTALYTSSDALLKASGSSAQLIEAYSGLNSYLEPHVCVKCGFVALFVKDSGQLKELPKAKGWKQVT